MPLDLKQNFFIGSGRAAKTETPQVTMPLILWQNDPQFRHGFGRWLQDNFETLVQEYKQYGRFLSLKELDELATNTDWPLGSNR